MNAEPLSKKQSVTRNRYNTIYVDMDDVLCETARAILFILERTFGKQVAYEDLTTFDLDQTCRLQPHEMTELFRLAHHPEELIAYAPVEDAISVITQWETEGYDIAIVTGRPPSTREPSLEWLRRHRVPHHSFIMVDKYGRFNTDSTVAISLDELSTMRFALAVEDSFAMASYLADRMATRVALVDRPWNRIDTAHQNITRYKRWDEIARAITCR